MAPGGIPLPYSALLALRSDVVREVVVPGSSAESSASWALLAQACAAAGVDGAGLEGALEARERERVLECGEAAWREMEGWRRAAVRRKALLYFPAPWGDL
jgi:hypothetical protein